MKNLLIKQPSLCLLADFKEAMELVPDEVVDTMTITGNVEQCVARISEYEGIADELILARTGQRNDTQTLKDYEEFFYLVSRYAD